MRFHAREKHHRRIGCFDSVDGDVERRSEGDVLCVCGPGESHDRVPREVWYCMRKSGVAEKYVIIV